MAFASVGTLGSTVTPKSSGTTQALAVSAQVEVGNVVVVAAAWDNAGTSQADTSQLSIADAHGNTWTKIRERTYSAGAANDGVTVAVWVSKITTQINNNAQITVTSASARTAKAMGAWEFTMGSGALTFDGAAGTDYNTASAAASDPASLSLSSLTSQEYLLIHAIGSEGGTTTTGDADYDERHDTETTGGSVATNISLYLGTRIATLTGDTVDAASTTDRDHAQVLGAVYEAAGGPTTHFGASSLTFQFNLTSGSFAKKNAASTQTLAFNFTSAGFAKKSAASSQTFVLGFTSNGARKTLASSSQTFTFGFGSNGVRTTHASSSQTVAFNLTSAGFAKKSAASSLPIVFGFVSEGTHTGSGPATHFGASTQTLTFGFASNAVRTTYGASAQTLVLGVLSTATRTTFAGSSLPIVFGITSDAQIPGFVAPVLLHFANGSPAGGASPGTPAGGANVGSPEALVFAQPSPEQEA